MSKKIFKGIFIISILTLLLHLLLYPLDITDWIVAQTISHYPKANDIIITTSSGFPDTLRWAQVTFRTPDESDAIMSYYKSYLKDHGWDENEDIILRNRTGSPFERRLEFSKKILSLRFRLRIIKAFNIPGEVFTRDPQKIFILVDHQPWVI